MDVDEILQKYLSNYSYHFQIPTISFLKKIRLKGEVDPLDIRKYLLVNNKNLQYLQIEDEDTFSQISDEELNCINYLIDKQNFSVEDFFIPHEKKEAIIHSLLQILSPIFSDEHRLEQLLLHLVPKLTSWKHRTIISLKHPSLSWLINYNEKIHSEKAVSTKTKQVHFKDSLLPQLEAILSPLHLQEKYLILSKLFEMIREEGKKQHLFLRRKTDIIHSNLFQSAVLAWWNRCTKGGDRLDKKHYFFMFMSLYHHLVLQSIRPFHTVQTSSHSKPVPITFFDAYSSVEQDWLIESGGITDSIQKDNFFVSLFELADTWCEEKTVHVFVSFLNSLLDRVFSVSDFHLQVEKLTSYLTPKTVKQVTIDSPTTQLTNDIPSQFGTPKRNILPFGEEIWSYDDSIMSSPQENSKQPLNETIQRILTTPLKRVNSSRHLVEAMTHLDSSPILTAAHTSAKVPSSPLTLSINTSPNSPTNTNNNSSLSFKHASPSSPQKSSYHSPRNFQAKHDTSLQHYFQNFGTCKEAISSTLATTSKKMYATRRSKKKLL